MSSTGDQETGGASIIPSARPSIHGHGDCRFAYTEAIMARYGIRSNNKQELSAQSSKQGGNQSNEHGTDEVDNVFSKPTHSLSPSSFAQRNRMRRKSFDEVEQQIERDSSQLSQSLPATFLLRSHCSDDSEVEPVRPEHQYSDTSYQSASLGTPQTNNTPVTNRRTVTNNFNHSNSLTPIAQNLRAIPIQEGSSRMLPLLVVVGILVTAASLFNTNNVSRKDIYDESRFYYDIELLGMKYRINENAVLQIQSGIATIFERQDTGSFVFVYNSNDDNFNSKEFNTFINDVSITASKYLRNESTPIHYTVIEGSNLDMLGHSELINTFRGDLDRTGVMLVKHVDAVPSALAMAFHFYCDEFNPLVKKSAIFFTLNLAKCPVSTDKKSPHAVIEKCLAQKWNGVSADSIGPLLTRVVNVVVDVNGAF